MSDTPPSPEFRDVPVTVLFTPYTPERRVNLDSNFFGEAGCSHRGETRCETRPDFLMRTNIAENGACFEHLTEVLEAMIAAAQRSDGDNTEQPGLLHRVVAPKRRPTAWKHVDYDPTDIIYATQIDRRYELQVFRSRQSHRIGVLVVSEPDTTPVLERPVVLFYGAPYGPDGDDVDQWFQMATAAIDAQKPTRQLIDEALARHLSGQRKVYRTLRTSIDAQLVFQKALETFEGPDNVLRWMLAPNAAFQGQSPVESINAQSVPRVLELLELIHSWDLRMAARASSCPGEA